MCKKDLKAPFLRRKEKKIKFMYNLLVLNTVAFYRTVINGTMREDLTNEDKNHRDILEKKLIKSRYSTRYFSKYNQK